MYISKSLKMRIIIFLFIIIIKIHCAFSQNLEQTIAFADKQFAAKNYNLALKEYQRALFFSENKYEDYLFQQIAEIYFVNQNYIQAATFYDYAYSITKNDSLKNEFIFKKASCYIIRYQYNYAIIELFNIKENAPKNIEKRKQFYLGLCYFGIENYLLAAECFFKVIEDGTQTQKKELLDIFTNRKNFFSPDAVKATIMSMIIPGSGQIYAGDTKNGINSFLLTAGFFLLGYSITVNYSFWDAFVSVFPWFLKYYQGGYTNAQKIAEMKRLMRRSDAFKKILIIIEKNNKKN
jgi:tetratricopeptide (TPR) repeat protein